MGIEDITSGLGARIGNASNGIGLGFGKGGFSISANFNQRLQKKLTKSNPLAEHQLKELYEEQYATPDIIFPADLDTEHFITFRQIDRIRDKSNSNETATTRKTIVLPLPNNLNPQYSANYKDQEMGIAGAFATGNLELGDVSKAVDTGKAFVEQGKQKFAEFAEKGKLDGQAGKDVKGVGAAIATVLGAGAIGSLLGGNIGAVLGAAVGGAGTVAQGVLSRANVTLNSHLAVLFDGVGFRTFTFTYRFVPRNPGESDNLRRMIYLFKKAMYPSLPAENKFMFTYPDEFLISFCDNVKPYMFNFKRSVLKDMQVTYNGDGVPRFFDDGSPTVVDLSMTFQEVEIVTKEDMKEPGDSA